MPGVNNMAFRYYCLGCGGIVFNLSWYLAPIVMTTGKRLKPGWAIECIECGRVTMPRKKPIINKKENHDRREVSPRIS